MVGLFKEFKNFAVKGNMIDMAIGVIIGASFNKVLDILVRKIILPPLSLMSDTGNFINSKIILRESVNTSTEISIGYGEFISASLDFVVIGLTLFTVVKVMNRIREKAEDINDFTFKTPKDIQLLSEINDQLKKQNELLTLKQEK